MRKISGKTMSYLKYFLYVAIVLGLAVFGLKGDRDRKAQQAYLAIETCNICHQDISEDEGKLVQFDGKTYHVSCLHRVINLDEE